MKAQLIVHGLIKIDGKILMIRRSKIKRGKPNFYPEYWDIPGGTVEPGEVPRVALVREIQEEVNLNAEVIRIIHEDSNFDPDKNTVFTRLVYICSVTNFDDDIIKLDPEEHSEFRFVEHLDEMMNENVVEYLQEIL